ncbi:hypothetical protein [Scatolibacter rhodanostii]|uniref:hypothetical protein n=1 Tax=Scatolibacter rhodanostii TaxID=2014781 RepID=UPI0013562E51|nr:hypothetical protein [Scatolibacter rhodanostii]
MKKFVIELDDTICLWLEHISDLTNESVEKLIANSMYNKIIAVEDDIVKAFTYSG